MKKLPEKDFKLIYQKVPRVTVDMVIKDSRGILLIKREIKPDIGKWHLPGGTVLYKEKVIDSLKRVAKEETGLQIRVKKFLSAFEYRKWKEPGYGHIISLVFLVEPIGGSLKGNARIAGEILKFFKMLPRDIILDQKKILQGKLIK